MINKILLCIALIVTLQTPVYAENSTNAFNALEKFFLAISTVDYPAMQAQVSESFVLLEDGEVWSIDDLIKVVVPTDYVRDNYFSIINSHEYDNLVTVNYWNKANFHNDNYNESVFWLESAIIKKEKGQWRLLQLHSTRLRPGKELKNAVFHKQSNPQQ